MHGDFTSIIPDRTIRMKKERRILSCVLETACDSGGDHTNEIGTDKLSEGGELPFEEVLEKRGDDVVDECHV